MDITDRLKRGAAWSALFIVAGGTAIVLAQAAAAPQAAPGAPQGPGPAPAGRAGGAGGARGARAGAPAPPRSAREIAPADLTGYWAAVVTQDWRMRMLTPQKGDYAGLPLNAEGRRVADEWDPAKDEAAGEQCRAYGAMNIMRLPGRLHVTWQDDQSLKVEADAGTQTRLLTFTPSGATGGDWQGVSAATWEMIPARRGPAQLSRSIKVVTTKVRPGYLRKNGVPYSANAIMTEYFDRVDQPSGDALLILTTTIEDPTYLAQPYMIATHFKKQNDAAGWNPTPCAAK